MFTIKVISPYIPNILADCSVSLGYCSSTMHYFRTYYKQYPQDEGQTPRREGRKGICYASQNFTFDGIFIFLAPLIFKVTSGAAAAATPKLLMAARCAPKKNHPH